MRCDHGLGSSPCERRACQSIDLRLLSFRTASAQHVSTSSRPGPPAHQLDACHNRLFSLRIISEIIDETIQSRIDWDCAVSGCSQTLYRQQYMRERLRYLVLLCSTTRFSFHIGGTSKLTHNSQSMVQAHLIFNEVFKVATSTYSGALLRWRLWCQDRWPIF